MATQFGKTWWGEHWLRSLDHIDYDNRLPRGAAYARNGYVKEVKIKENQILAKVAGSRPTPYKVTIIVPPFFDEQIDLLMNKIIENPALISKLLNRELDPAILTIAEEVGLKVFPKQWTDFKMQCSCPDWAVPCKHLAAVVYMVSREIDNNPFLVFDIHKVNLLEELQKRGIFIADQKKSEIQQLKDILKARSTKTFDFDDEIVYSRVDFSQLQSISEALVQLLPDSPPFYLSGNFREKYASQYIRITKEAKRILGKKLDFDAIFLSSTTMPLLTNRSKVSLSIDTNNELKIKSENFDHSTIKQLIPAIFKLNPDHLPDFESSVAAIHKVLFASLHLLANGMVIPQIVQLDNKSFIIRWLPAMIDHRVKELIEKLTQVLPPDLLLAEKVVRKKVQIAPLENQTIELLSLFITQLLSHLSKSSNGDLFEDLFFKNKSYHFNAVGETALSGGINPTCS